MGQHVFIYLTCVENGDFNFLQTTHLILQQTEYDVICPLVRVTALIPFVIDDIGILLGTSQGQIVRFYKESQRNQFIAGTEVIGINRMNNQFLNNEIQHLCVIGFSDHQINIFDYDRFLNLWVFKEGFTIPVSQIFVKVHMNNDFILGAAEDGSITFWQINQQIVDRLAKYKKIQESANLVREFPKFDVVPYSKICHIHKSPLKFIEFYGTLIASLEESGMFRIWYMEHTMKQFITIWKLKIDEQILSFNLNEEFQLIFMGSSQKIFLIGIPSTEKGDFHCRVIPNTEQAQYTLFDFNINVLSWIRNKDGQISSGAKILEMDMDLIELDY